MNPEENSAPEDLLPISDSISISNLRDSAFRAAANSDWSFSYSSGVTTTGMGNMVMSQGSNDHFSRRQQSLEERHQREQQRRSRDQRTPNPASRGPYRAVSPQQPMKVSDNTTCVHCERHYDRHDGRSHIKIGGCHICIECAAADYIRCVDCRTYTHRDDAFRNYQGVFICETCRMNEYAECRGCRNVVRASDSHEVDNNTYCPNCMPIRDRNAAERLAGESDDIYRNYFNKDKKFCSLDQGDTIKSTRIFSAEIECYYPDVETMQDFAKKTPKHLGIGSDGSLNGNSGVELRTPILQGKKGEKFIREVCGYLMEDGFTTDRCCGLHIHLDGGKILPAKPRGINPVSLKLLWIFYLTFEDVILSFLPKERRGNNYCRLLRPCFHISEIWNARDLEELEKIWYRSANRTQIANMKRDTRHDTRYHGFNIHCLLSQNHLEVRFHSGTVNTGKILEWINLHQLIMDRAEVQSLDYTTMLNTYNFTEVAEKREIFFDMLALPDSTKKYLMKRAAKFSDKRLNEESLTEI